ncbi:MAG TPA: hypothetical protein VNN62_07720 [Methylomirabilota bacterium]|jgi:cytochrome c1|nr:hypothetical protein [Methylomirabilota bacterium]
MPAKDYASTRYSDGEFAPRTAMPNNPMSEQEARDIAGYLYTLR